nr:Uroporphyrinogen III synthase UROS/HEM4 [Ipomoea batatas]
MIILNLQHPPPLISWGTPHSSQSKNRVIAFTTPQNYASRLSDLIHLKGWTPLWCPTVIVEPTPQTISSIRSHISPNPNPLLEDFSAIAFTSRTGISAFSEALSSIGTYPLTPTGEILVISALGKDLELLDESFISRICENPGRIRVVAPRIATPTGLVEALGDGEGKKKVLCPVPLVVGLEEPPVVPAFLKDLAKKGWVPVRVNATGEVEGLLKSLKEYGLDWETVRRMCPGLVVAAHGPVTASGAERLGVGIDVVSSRFDSFDGVVHALAHQWECLDS